MTKGDTSAIVAMAKDKTSKKVDLVLCEIAKMQKKNENISIYSVSKKAGVSRSFLYNNKVLFNKIDSIRNDEARSEHTIQTIVEAQKLKITKLEKEIAELKKNENFRKKYEELSAQNKELKKQLEVAYSY